MSVKNFNLNNKVVLITGGTRGIGKATSIAFAEAGAQVMMCYKNNADAANELLKKLPGSNHSLFQADISKSHECEKLISEAVHKYGRIDIFVNNAGIFIRENLLDFDFEKWQEAWEATLKLNLFGPANLCYLAAKQMQKQGGGKIINVSSRGAFRGEPGNPAYGASKAGLNSLSQSLAQALAPHNIFVGVVAPGFVETEMSASVLNSPKGEEIRKQSPFNRVAKPEEVAHAIVLLAFDGNEFMTGCIIDVNGASYLRS
ncbi:MAG TPA: 3-oxoacyl-ACP reductase [Bacteroidales bacterium]|nr:MAG: 3-oxoacyl-ACP reductase [Bacteroidetes bacterium GWF2_35_48]HBX53233.1 3-oxoacyl-ACP reductase [Bacteroidales bacterium]